ncbi:MAG: GNAT family N-acetyltransferase [Chitinophagales bacterium]|nr:GNAT family N-acetyltransferase [Chitinophagales bacterium]
MMYQYQLLDGWTEAFFISAKKIFNQSPHRFFYQDPDWMQLDPHPKRLLAVTDPTGSLLAYAAVEIKSLRTLQLAFGPVLINQEELPQIIAGMARWLKKNGWWRFTVQLPVPDRDGGREAVEKTGRLISFRQSARLFNWKSWWLALDHEPAQLMKSFSHHHQKSVRQGLKHQISYLEATTDEQALQLAQLYIEMYRHRKLPVNDDDARKLFIAVGRYIQLFKKGIMLQAVMDGRTVGGIVIIFQGNTAYYYLGVTTISYKRSIPILYTAFYHVMELCRQARISTLDFGGIAIAGRKGVSLHNINRFKMGFGGEEVNYPEQLVFDLNPVLSRCIETAVLWRNRLRQWKVRQ